MFASPQVRLARQLVELMDTHGRDVEQGCEISVPLTIAELAGMAGVSRNYARRYLEGLKKSEIIGTRGRRFTVQKPEELRKIAGSA
jgi:CRP-like cAMP-binding protein